MPLFSDLPAYFAKRFAADATSSYIRTIPATTADPNAASMSTGFPPNTFTDEGAGGSPPDGRDFNGILNFLSAWAQWMAIGGPVPYNPAVSSSGGYPLGAIVLSASTAGLAYESTVDGNVTNPDSGGSAGWIPRVGRRASTAELVNGTSDGLVATPLGLKNAGFDPIVSQNLAVNGYRAYRSGYKECWGRVIVPANSTFTVNMPIAHVNFIVPTLGAQLIADGASPCRVGLTPPALNQFVIVNNDADSRSVNWSTHGS